MRSWNRIAFYIFLLAFYLLGYQCFADNANAANENIKQEPTKSSSNSSQKNDKNIITSLGLNSEGIEVNSNSEISEYKTFTLTKPQRLVIDLYNVKTNIEANTLKLNRFGIKNARIGIYPDKVRIVFDSYMKKFPQYKIDKSAKGIVIVFNDSVNDKEVAHVKKDPAKSKVAIIESIDFKQADGYSDITLTSDQPLNISKPSISDKTFVITAKNCILKKNLQRPLNTKAFSSNVSEIIPYQVKAGGANEVKILIKLHQEAPFEVKTEGNSVHIEVKNTVIPETAKKRITENRHVIPSKANSNVHENKEPVTINPAGAGRKAYTGSRVTLEFADADIRKIFQLIGEVSNLNFVLSDDVKGTISIKLVNVPWDQALDVILETKGLGMQREGNIVLIRPIGKIKTFADEQQAEKLARERAMELKTKVFDVNFSSVSEVADQFKTLKSERGIIAQDPRTNRVIVTDIEPALGKMASLLKALDIPEKQVMIESRIVEASSDFSRDLGIQWGIHYLDGSASFLGINQLDTAFGGVVTNTAPTSGFQDPATSGGAMGLSFGKLTNNIQLDLRLSAAETTGQAKIISTPKVVTLNNKAAKISQGQSIPYQTTSAEGTKTEFVEAALTLEVTPHITANGEVLMKIKASNNSPGTPVQGSTAPPINKKEATTELLVKNGETTVIGGIYVNNDSVSNTGLPFLKDIPLLGWLFKSNSKKSTRTELLIFITPKIVS